MEISQNQNKDMSLEEWYNNYLMTYVKTINNLKHSENQFHRFNKKLLEWYNNWNGQQRVI